VGWLSRQFNDSNKAWANQRRAMQRKRKGLGLNVPADQDINRVAGQWRRKGKRYLRNVPDRLMTKAGNAQIVVTSEGWEDLLELPIAATIEIMDREMTAIALRVWDDAPVKSGLFKSRWQVNWFLDGDELVVALENDTPYAMLTRRGGSRTKQKNINLATRLVKSAALDIGIEIARKTAQGS